MVSRLGLPDPNWQLAHELAQSRFTTRPPPISNFCVYAESRRIRIGINRAVNFLSTDTKAWKTTRAVGEVSHRKALRSLPPYVKLHIVKQEFHEHQYGNGKVDIQAVNQRTTDLPTLQAPDLDRNHTHLEHLPLKPEPHQTPDWVPDDAPYTSQDRAYHYPYPIQHHARVLGDTDSRAHIQELQETLKATLGHSVLRPACVPAHLQKRRIQLLREQLPFLTRVARWLARKHIHMPGKHTHCPWDHTEDWEHFKICLLHAGRDTLVGWSPAEPLQQHKGWPTHKHTHQATKHLFRDPLIREVTMRAALTQAL